MRSETREPGQDGFAAGYAAAEAEASDFERAGFTIGYRRRRQRFVQADAWISALAVAAWVGRFGAVRAVDGREFQIFGGEAAAREKLFGPGRAKFR